MIHSNYLFIYPILGLSLQSVAAETELTAEQHRFEHSEVIVVTGTRTPKLLSNSPVSIDVIAAEEVALLSQGTVAQTLNYIPGVVVVQNQKDGYNIQMQGFDGDNVLILLNSQPLISPTGAAVDLDQISAHDIQQIEVIRGAASVMYGSSAMGGVINIITKQTDKAHLKLSYEVGSFVGNQIKGDELAHQTRLKASFNAADWHNQLAVLIKQTPGFDYDDNHNSMPAGEIDKSFVNLSTRGKLNQLTTEVKYQFFNEQKDKPIEKIAGQSNLVRYISEVDQHQLDFHLGKDVFDKQKHQIELTSWQLNARLMQHKEISGQTGSQREANIGLYELNGQHVWSLSGLEVVAGGVVHQDTLEQVKLSDDTIEVPVVTKESIEAFSQANWINPNNQFLLGIRAQNDSDFGDHYAVRFSGMLALLDRADKLKWRFGLGQGYRVPTLKERFYEFDHSALGYKVYGNQNLKPEESLSFNTSLTYQTNVNSTQFGNFEWTSEANVHYTKADNLIDSFTDLERSAIEKLDISVYGNIEQATIQGFDLSTKLTFLQWSTQLSYNYLDARDQNEQRLENRPYHQAKANLGYNNLKYDLNALIYLVYQQGEATVETYPNGVANNEWITFDFKINQQLTEQLSWRFGIENIFDQHKNDQGLANLQFDARAITSRFISIGLSYQFY